MDWIRRNWPDLIIGLALLAVIAGIIATLLSGGSFFGGVPANAPSVTPPATTAPQAAPTPAATAPDTATEVLPPGPPVLPDPAVADEGSTQGDVVAVVPETSELASSDAETITPLAPGTNEVITASEGDAPVLETPVEPQADAQMGLQNSAAGTLFPESPYRISVGSYRDASNAERRAESFRTAGYPVFIGQQDDLSIVLIGPYDERTEAEAALAAIQRDGLEAAPLLFELADDPSESANVVETAASAISESVSNATTQTQVVLPGNLTQGSYLQAGAYDTSEGARPQRERLESFGFNVAEIQEGSFIKLLVGPFNEDSLSSAQTRLSAQGVDHFVRTF